MKKILFVFLISCACLTPFIAVPATVKADGLVPCGTGDIVIPNPDYDPLGGFGPTSQQQYILNPQYHRCEISDVFALILNVYTFIVLYISTPLAGLLAVIGGIMLIVSGGNPGLASRAKNLLKYTAFAILLIFGSWLLIVTVLRILTGS